MLKMLVVKAVKSVANFTKNEIQCAVEDYHVACLVRKTNSPSRTQKVIAFATLRKYYPEVYVEVKGNDVQS